MSSDLSPLALALGRIPTGLYVISTLHDGSPLGFVGSFVMQVGFDPPALSVAIARGREHLAAIRSHGSFALSVLDGASQNLMAPFLRRLEPGKSAFDGLACATTPGGLSVLSGALAWLECRVTGEHPVGDHVVVFGNVLHAACLRAGDPVIHLRRNGLAY
jgi:flavin reductase (DIM6/NTAB) family NADH-FMN oxidoreductase RutF